MKFRDRIRRRVLTASAAPILLLGFLAAGACSGEQRDDTATPAAGTTATTAAATATTATTNATTTAVTGSTTTNPAGTDPGTGTGTATETGTAAEAAPSHPHSSWTQRKLIDKVTGATIEVEGRRVRVDGATVACSGEGPPFVANGTEHWRHFSCVQPTLGGGGLAGPDALFRVHVLGGKSFLVTDAHFSRY